MEKDNLKELLIMNVPNHKGNFNKVYEACERAKRAIRIKRFKYIQVVAFVVALFLVSASSIMIYRGIGKAPQNTTVVPPRDEYLEEHLLSHLEWIGKQPVFDSYIAIGPEDGSKRISLDVLLKTNLLKEEDKNVLIEYANDANEKEFNHEARFLICFGTIEEKDYIFLADMYYDETSNWIGYVTTTFYFESNLSYPFSSLADEFEDLAGDSLTNECITSYNDQNILECGIAICFERLDDGTYKEYYLMKTYDKQEFVVKK